MTRDALPIDEVLEAILRGIERDGAVVLKAPAGAGKTTGVPLAMLESEPPLGRLWLAQPRRLAARAAAARLAQHRGVAVGQEVGYQVRFDRRWGRSTRMVAVTTGVLLRRLQSDPFLEGIDAVVLDEFHERSLEADVALGMVQRLRQTVRPELKLVVMSATLDPEPIADFLRTGRPLSAEKRRASPETEDAVAPPVTVIESVGRAFPVTIRYQPSPPRRPIEEQVADAVPVALDETDGDLLIFLPGVGEIRRVERTLQPLLAARRGSARPSKGNRDKRNRGKENRGSGGRPRDRQAEASPPIEILTLFGDMPPAAQDAVLQPSDRRKIVLATNVAETSVTIPGVTAVIDSGLARILRYDPRVGLPRLEIEPISQAAAAQRAGRAGRTSAGLCIRLWAEASQRARPERDTPEILRTDLAGAVLQLAGWGETDISAFPWLDPPPATAIATAQELLRQLGAVRLPAADEVVVTDLGRRMLQLPIHPRLARLLLAGEALGVAGRAAVVAAMLSERDPFRGRLGSGVPKGDNRAAAGSPRAPRPVSCGRSDVIDRLTRLEAYADGRDDPAIQHVAAKHVFRVAEQLAGLVDGGVGPQHSRGGASDEAVMRALLAAYPDRLARRRTPGSDRAVTAGGQGVRLLRESQTREGEFFVCIDVQHGSGDAKVRVASAVDRQWLDEASIVEADECFFHPTLQQVTARRRTYWNGLMLSETPTDRLDPDEAQRLLYEQALRNWHKVFPEEDAALQNWLARVGCLAAWLPEQAWPQIDETILQDVAFQLCRGRRSFAELRQAPWQDFLLGKLSYDQQQQLNQLAPTEIEVPSGNRFPIEYQIGKPPVLAVRLQELFGWQSSPTIAGGQVRLQLHLLAPNQRPQQVTDDLASFWTNTYPQVRKDLRGRYAKHHWPEDPQHAPATRSGLRRDAEGK